MMWQSIGDAIRNLKKYQLLVTVKKWEITVELQKEVEVKKNNDDNEKVKQSGVNPFALIDLGRYQVAICYVTHGQCLLMVDHANGQLTIKSPMSKEYTDNALLIFNFLQDPFKVSVSDVAKAIQFYGWDITLRMEKKILAVNGKDRREIEMFLWMSGLYPDTGFSAFWKEYTTSKLV